MQHRNRLRTVQSLLCLMAFTVVLASEARAMNLLTAEDHAFFVAGQQGAQDKPDSAPQEQPKTKAVVLTGTIVKNGSDLVLQDSTGVVYQLDAQDKAKSFEGKSVKITGRLESTSNLLHVEIIEGLSA